MKMKWRYVSISMVFFNSELPAYVAQTALALPA
jgi:hypothetical protein